LRGPQFPWVRIFLKIFPLLHATAARWDPFLQAAANFLWDLQIAWVSSFGSPRCSAARFWPVLLPQFSDRFRHGMFLRDLPVFLLGLCFLRICFQISGLSHFSIGLHLFSSGIQFGS
jgi:hypothetical protein